MTVWTNSAVRNIFQLFQLTKHHVLSYGTTTHYQKQEEIHSFKQILFCQDGWREDDTGGGVSVSMKSRPCLHSPQPWKSIWRASGDFLSLVRFSPSAEFTSFYAGTLLLNLKKCHCLKILPHANNKIVVKEQTFLQCEVSDQAYSIIKRAPQMY